MITSKNLPCIYQCKTYPKKLWNTRNRHLRDLSIHTYRYPVEGGKFCSHSIFVLKLKEKSVRGVVFASSNLIKTLHGPTTAFPPNDKCSVNESL